MTINLYDIIVDRSPAEKAIRLKTIRAELDKEGYTIVETEWFRRLNAAILKRGIEA